MSSIFSTQKRHTFLRRKYCFFCVATALSPPVGRCPALPGLPLDSAIFLPFTPLGPVRQASAGRRMAAPVQAPPLLCDARACRGSACVFQDASTSHRYARLEI